MGPPALYSTKRWLYDYDNEAADFFMTELARAFATKEFTMICVCILLALFRFLVPQFSAHLVDDSKRRVKDVKWTVVCA